MGYLDRTLILCNKALQHNGCPRALSVRERPSRHCPRHCLPPTDSDNGLRQRVGG